MNKLKYLNHTYTDRRRCQIAKIWFCLCRLKHWHEKQMLSVTLNAVYMYVKKAKTFKTQISCKRCIIFVWFCIGFNLTHVTMTTVIMRCHWISSWYLQICGETYWMLTFLLWGFNHVPHVQTNFHPEDCDWFRWRHVWVFSLSDR